ncbi:MAG: hypothetical protein H8D23_39030, partial [Candidatus Brocadiales bacterium]|nr:hypothetical protein [Candidatus Brocadiales bacterium]
MKFSSVTLKILLTLLLIIPCFSLPRDSSNTVTPKSEFHRAYYRNFGNDLESVTNFKYKVNVAAMSGAGLAMMDAMGDEQTGNGIAILGLMLIQPIGSVYYTHRLGKVGSTEAMEGRLSEKDLSVAKSLQRGGPQKLDSGLGVDSGL